MSVPLVDFHCHLDLYSDFENIIKESEAAKIYTLAVTTTPRAWERNELLMKDLKYVRPALGFHPQLVNNDSAKELLLWEKLLSRTKYVGEVGIDAGPVYYKTLEAQKRVFERILRLCAKEGNKILSVHAVRSVDIVLDRVESLLSPDRGTVVIHWFSGTQKQAKRAVDLGCYFSINASMLNSKNGQSIVRVLPPSRILLETDGPFTKINGNISRPKDISTVIEILSGLLNIQPDRLKDDVLNNLKAMLN